MMQVEAVIFDHDGTLVDSETITLDLLATMAIEAGADIDPENVGRFVGADIRLVLAEIERSRGSRLPIDFLDQFRSRQEQAIRDHLTEIDGATDLLTAIDLPMAVASNAPVVKLELCLGVTGLDRFFQPQHLVSAYDVGAWKPDPAVFIEAARILGHAPQNCAVVEDSEPGVIGAVAAGMQVFALESSGSLPKLRGVTAVSSLHELHDFLT
ncbi:MAG: HAD superfamily hydrolase (TIGR01509 family) [Verrucomicrobiales bacterium]|jgi:HAD superfamily hydrolase (TIGR01509 family)